MNSSRISDSEQLLVELNKYLTIIHERVLDMILYIQQTRVESFCYWKRPQNIKKLHVNQNQNKKTLKTSRIRLPYF